MIQLRRSMVQAMAIGCEAFLRSIHGALQEASLLEAQQDGEKDCDEDCEEDCDEEAQQDSEKDCDEDCDEEAQQDGEKSEQGKMRTAMRKQQDCDEDCDGGKGKGKGRRDHGRHRSRSRSRGEKRSSRSRGDEEELETQPQGRPAKLGLSTSSGRVEAANKSVFAEIKSKRTLREPKQPESKKQPKPPAGPPPFQGQGQGKVCHYWKTYAGEGCAHWASARVRMKGSTSSPRQRLTCHVCTDYLCEPSEDHDPPIAEVLEMI